MPKKIYDFEEHRKVFLAPAKNPEYWAHPSCLINAYSYWEEYKNKPDRESILYQTIVDAYENQTSCSVIEHGGRFGEQYINAMSIGTCSKLTWKIIEIPTIVKAGRAEFAKKYPITYNYSIYNLKKKADITCSSASFMFIESDWENFIKKMGELTTQFVVFNKTPTTDDGDKTHWFMHRSEVPYVVLSISDTIDILEDFTLVHNEPHPKGRLAIHPGVYTNLVFARK